MPWGKWSVGAFCCGDGPGGGENIGCEPCDLPAGDNLTLSWDVPFIGASGSVTFAFDSGTQSWNTGCIASNATTPNPSNPEGLTDTMLEGFMDCSTGGIHFRVQFFANDPFSPDPCSVLDFTYEFQAAAGNISIVSSTCGRGSFTEVWSDGGDVMLTVSP